LLAVDVGAGSGGKGAADFGVAVEFALAVKGGPPPTSGSRLNALVPAHPA
jgi:hypothetical protein